MNWLFGLVHVKALFSKGEKEYHEFIKLKTFWKLNALFCRKRLWLNASIYPHWPTLPTDSLGKNTNTCLRFYREALFHNNFE